MLLGRVIGNVVATTKVPGLEGIRLLLVQPVDEAGKDRGKPLIGVGIAPQTGIHPPLQEKNRPLLHYPAIDSGKTPDIPLEPAPGLLKMRNDIFRIQLR